MQVFGLSEIQRDVLREISNIGAGNAATAFAKMVDHKINMEVPRMEICPLSEVAELLGGAETPVVGVLFRVDGSLASNLLFVLDRTSASKLLAFFLNVDKEIGVELTELEASALCEIGNILSSSYLGALQNITSLDFKLSVPALAVDMAGAIVDTVLIPLGEVGNYALLIENVFVDGVNRVKGHFFLLPDPGTFEKIFAALGV